MIFQQPINFIAMKHLLLFLFMSVNIAAFGQYTSPVTFDTLQTKYILTDFGNNVSEIIADPTDATNLVAKSVKTDSAETWAGTTIGAAASFGKLIFTEGSTTITVRVWSPDANTPVMFKIENSANGSVFVETTVNTTVAEQWETLTYNIVTETPEAVYNKGSIFFNFGTAGSAAGEKIYYWDDVTYTADAPPTGAELPVTFEETSIDFGLGGFGGATPEIVVDPTNEDNKVVRVVKSDAAEVWGGAQMDLAAAIPFTEDGKFLNVRVWSPDSGAVVRLKVEKLGDNSVFAEVDAETTVNEGWQILNFDLGNPAGGSIDLTQEYKRIAFFPNFGTDGATAGEKTFYFDDFIFGQKYFFYPTMPITFEENLPWIQAITNFDGGEMTIVENPDKSEFNPSDSVLKAIKGTGQVWAGSFLSFDAPMDLTGANAMQVNVWSPRAGAVVTVKLESADHTPGQQDGLAFEVPATVAVEAGWDVLTFAIPESADRSLGYIRMVFFIDLGTMGDGSEAFTFYYDDVKTDATVTSIDDERSFIPATTALNQNYPNPFNPSTSIAFTLAESSQVSLEVFDLMGRQIATLADQANFTAGSHTISFDASGLSTGTYLYRMMTSSGFTATKKMLLIK